MRTVRKVDYWEMLDDGRDGNVPSGKQKKNRPPKQKQVDYDSRIRNMLAEELKKEENQFDFTYQASRHEQQWISAALQEFHHDSLISDVLRMVRAGKEANVYCCQAHSNIGLDLLAAKIYRPRLLRNLKNDALYKEGRTPLGDDGKALRNSRELRAIHKKTHFGKELEITSWIEHEYVTLKAFFASGIHVPRPVAQSGNAILMEHIGEAYSPAAVLASVTLSPDEAQYLFMVLMKDVEEMLAHNCVHADLSAYNVLYWEGQVTIIDFPQVVDPLFNEHGYDLLARDIHRLCQYFQRYGVYSNPARLATDLWGRYLRHELDRK
jgi:RIO kinase 1